MKHETCDVIINKQAKFGGGTLAGIYLHFNSNIACKFPLILLYTVTYITRITNTISIIIIFFN